MILAVPVAHFDGVWAPSERDWPFSISTRLAQQSDHVDTYLRGRASDFSTACRTNAEPPNALLGNRSISLGFQP